MINISKNYFYQPSDPYKLIIPKDKSYASVVPQLVQTAEEIASKAEDYELRDPAAHNMMLRASNRLSFKYGKTVEEHELRNYALRQLCAKLKMPYAFFEYLTSKAGASSLAHINVNSLLYMCHDDMLIRMCDGKIRGLLSSKYCCFDSNRILDVFTSAVDNNRFIDKDELEIKGYINDMERLHIRFTNAKPIKGVPDKDIEYGLQIDSSDVGKSSIKVRFMIYKQLCTNGLSIGYLDSNLFSQSHIGKITADELAQGLRRSFQQFPIIAAQATDIINSAEGHPMENSGLVDFSKIDDASKRERKRMQLFLGVGEDAMRTIAGIASQSYRPTSWGYVNAITEYAQRFDFERRAELEQLAGKILIHPTNFFAA